MLRAIGCLGVGFVGGYIYATQNGRTTGRASGAQGEGSKIVSSDIQQAMKEGKQKISEMKEQFEGTKDSLKQAVKKDWNKSNDKEDSDTSSKGEKNEERSYNVSGSQTVGLDPRYSREKLEENKLKHIGEKENPQVPNKAQNAKAVGFKGELGDNDKNAQIQKGGTGMTPQDTRYHTDSTPTSKDTETAEHKGVKQKQANATFEKTEVSASHDGTDKDSKPSNQKGPQRDSKNANEKITQKDDKQSQGSQKDDRTAATEQNKKVQAGSKNDGTESARKS